MNLIRSSLCGGRVVRVEVGRERHRGRAGMVGGGLVGGKANPHACMYGATHPTERPAKETAWRKRNLVWWLLYVKFPCLVA